MSAPSSPFDKFIRKYGTPASILLGALIIAGSIFLSFGYPNLRATRNSKPQTTAKPGPSATERVNNDPVLGQPGARVTIVEFSDFQCPFCRKFWRETLPELKKQYIDAGQAKLVYRDFPLTSIHPGSEIAAEAGECADEQGKFWEMHDKIFSEQDKQGIDTVQFTAQDLKKWGKAIGLNPTKFNTCLDAHKYKREVEKDIADGSAAGVDATPTFFVNGLKIRGAQPYNVFVQVIDDELKIK